MVLQVLVVFLLVELEPQQLQRALRVQVLEQGQGQVSLQGLGLQGPG